MEQITKQLEAVRRRSRTALLLQRLCQWVTALLAIGLMLGLLDFALRLPAWARVVMGVVIAIAAIAWLFGRLGRAMSFKPDLSILALRAERIYPHLAGRLASAVEFAAHPEEYRDPQRTADLVAESVNTAQGGADRLDFSKLIDPTRTVRLLSLSLVAAIIFCVIIFIAPQSSAIAAQRWFAPLAGVEWPRRTNVASGVSDNVWPSDSALNLMASVDKGHYPGMRVTAHYRFIDDAGPRRWQTVLLNEQKAGGANETKVLAHYDRLVDLPALDVQADPRVEFYFEAGDDQSEVQELAIVERPRVQIVDAIVDAPAYAAGLLPRQRVSLSDQRGAIATLAALRGSSVQINITFNKPLPIPQDDEELLAQMLPGLDAAEAGDVKLLRNVGSQSDAGNATGNSATGVSLTLPLTADLQTEIHLLDGHGLANVSERQYRLSVNEDQKPTASLTEPASDESVLPGAVVSLRASAQDDVALEELLIEAEAPERAGESDAPQPGMATQILARQTGRQATLDVEHTLELEPLQLKPGDVVTLTAIALDVYEFNGLRHEPMRSTPRRLLIIDEAKLLGQLRSELAGVRQQAVRTRTMQEQTEEMTQEGGEADAAADQQQRVTQRLDRQGRQIDAMRQRIERNQLDDDLLDQLLDDAKQRLDEAQAASKRAEGELREAKNAAEAGNEAEAQENQQQAGEQQAIVEEQLDELVDLLDQGRDAAALSMALKQMRALQESLAGDTNDLLPETIGRDPEELSEEQREALEALRDRQQELADQAEQMVDRMQSTAEALSRQSENERDQAAAQAMSEAAAIARRQGLQQQMQQSADALEQNRMSQANNQQQQTMQTLEEMLEEMGNQKERMQEILRRRLLELANAIEQLLQQQKQELAAAQAEQRDWPLLEERESALRRRTIAVEEQARGSSETQPAADPLALAVEAQGQAILAMRVRNANAVVTSEENAIEQLEEALRIIREKKQQMEEEEAREQREELRQQYEALAEREETLKGDVGALLEDGQLTRRERADIVQRAAEQSAIRDEAAALEEKVEQTLVFKALHERVADASDEAASTMQRGQADAALLRQQERVAIWLRTMAAALEEDQGEPSDFAEPEQPQDDQSGGGAGAGEQPPDMIPPIAELKLMRALQEVIYQQTRTADEIKPLNADEVRMLSDQQQELSDLGLQLIEKMQQQMQPMQPDDTDGKSRGEPGGTQ